MIMNITLRTMILSAIIAFVAGCAATGTPFALDREPEPNKATLYVYRPESAINCCVAPYIYINGEERGQLKNGGYLKFYVEPGSISVEAVNTAVGFSSLKLTLASTAGSSYFLRWSVSAAMGIKSLRDTSTEEEREKWRAGAFILNKEAKKRLEEGRVQASVRATDAADAIPESKTLAIEHERELRLVNQNDALKEIVRTKGSN